MDRADEIPRTVLCFLDSDGYIANLECVYYDDALPEWPRPDQCSVLLRDEERYLEAVAPPAGAVIRPHQPGDRWVSFEVQTDGGFCAATWSGYRECLAGDGSELTPYSSSRSRAHIRSAAWRAELIAAALVSRRVWSGSVRGRGDVEITVRVPGRGKLVAVGVVALAVVVGAGGWLLWLPAWRPALQAGERYGIDVSAHQGEIDWAAVAADDIEFAYLKATEGTDFTDRRFGVNWVRVDRAGLQRGAYHFYSLCSSGAAQARHFLSVAAPDPGVLPPAVDLELAGNCRSRPPPEELMHELGVFLTTVESAWGRQVLLYLGDDFEAKYRIRDHVDRSLWQPNFLRRPAGDGWLLWQVSGFSRVAGVPGRVDLDVARLCARSPGRTC